MFIVIYEVLNKSFYFAHVTTEIDSVNYYSNKVFNENTATINFQYISSLSLC